MVTEARATKQLAEHILAADYESSTRDFFGLVREGTPPLELGHQALLCCGRGEAPLRRNEDNCSAAVIGPRDAPDGVSATIRSRTLVDLPAGSQHVGEGSS